MECDSQSPPYLRWSVTDVASPCLFKIAHFAQARPAIHRIRFSDGRHGYRGWPTLPLSFENPEGAPSKLRLGGLVDVAISRSTPKHVFRPFETLGFLLLGASACSVVLGFYLIHALRRVLHTHCPLCYAAHAINIVLFVLLIFVS